MCGPSTDVGQMPVAGDRNGEGGMVNPLAAATACRCGESTEAFAEHGVASVRVTSLVGTGGSSPSARGAGVIACDCRGPRCSDRPDLERKTGTMLGSVTLLWPCCDRGRPKAIMSALPTKATTTSNQTASPAPPGLAQGKLIALEFNNIIAFRIGTHRPGRLLAGGETFACNCKQARPGTDSSWGNEQHARVPQPVC